MAAEFRKKLCMCGYHAYNIWEAAVGEMLVCVREPRNTHDRYAVVGGNYSWWQNFRGFNFHGWGDPRKFEHNENFCVYGKYNTIPQHAVTSFVIRTPLARQTALITNFFPKQYLIIDLPVASDQHTNLKFLLNAKDFHLPLSRGKRARQRGWTKTVFIEVAFACQLCMRSTMNTDWNNQCAELLRFR